MATDFSGGTDTQMTSSTEAFLLQTATITIKNGKTIDLTNVILDIEVFEDIFKSSITGSITINDFVGGLEKFVLTGGERITLKAGMPAEGNKTIINRSNLIVHEFSKIKADSTANLRYKLYFTSESALDSLKKRVFKSYGAERNIYNIVESLYSKMEALGGTSTGLVTTQVYLGYTRPSAIEITASDAWLPKPFLSPGYTPIDAINSLAKRSSSAGKYYVFYERLNYNKDSLGIHHYFTSIDDIIKNTDPNKIPTIKYSPAGNYFSTTLPEFNIRAKTVEYQNNYNHLSSMVGGFYNSRIRSLDILSRRYTDTTINYKNTSDSNGGTSYLGKYLDSSNYFSTYGDKDYPGERLIVSPMNDPFTNKKEWIKNDTYGAFLNSSIRITVDVAGGTNRIGAGDVVDLRLPSRTSQAVNLESAIIPDDTVYSGRYIVTACRHKITRLGYTKKLELSRGNFRLNIDQLIANF
jgi:hypothetical protein